MKNDLYPMDWQEIQMNIGNPVYDKKEKRWRILDGYKMTNNTFCVLFTDSGCWEYFPDKKIYLKELQGDKYDNTNL